MKAILVDSFASIPVKTEKNSYEFLRWVPMSTDPLFALAKKIKTIKEDSVVIIHTHLSCEDEIKPDCLPGIELIKMLRMIGDHRHIYLYSPLYTLDELVRESPYHLILYTPGITLYDPTSLDHAPKDASVNKFSGDLSPYLKVGFHLPREQRHDWANWWGVYQLWTVHQDLYPHFSQTIPQKIEAQLYDIRNQKALFLYRNTPAIKPGETNLYPTKEKEEIDDLRQKLKSKPPRILYLDDQAHEGWAEILSRIIYGAPPPPNTFNVIAPRHEEIITLQHYFEHILKPYIAKFQPELLIFDLRLQKDSLTLSGAKLMGFVRSCFPGLPSMFITASQRSASLREGQEMGLDAYWVKEGIDQQFSWTETVGNYHKLLKTISTLCTGEFSDICRLNWFYFTHFNSKKTYWWDRKEWSKKGGKNYARKKNIIEDIKHGILSYRRIMLNATEATGHFEAERPVLKRQLTSLIVSLFIIIERIHLDKELTKFDAIEVGGEWVRKDSTFRSKRGDYFAMFLSKIRNGAVHFSKDFQSGLNTHAFMHFFSAILLWLKTDFDELHSFDPGVIKQYRLDPKITWEYLLDGLIIPFFKNIDKAKEYNTLVYGTQRSTDLDHLR